MAGNVDSTPPSPVTTGTSQGSDVTPTGDHNGTPVTSLGNPDRKLDGLTPNQTSQASMDDRDVSIPSSPPNKQIPSSKQDKPESAKEKNDRELEEARKARENSTLEELEAEQDKLLEEAGEKFEKVEQHTVLGKALAALKDPENAPKDVKVTIQLPGESKPITLVPPDKKALKGRNVEELTALATKLLTQFNNEEMAGFNAGEFNQRLGMIREMLEDVGKKISEKGKGGNDWQKRFEELQQRQAVVVVRERLPGEEDDFKRARVTVTGEKPEKPEPVQNDQPPWLADDVEQEDK